MVEAPTWDELLVQYGRAMTAAQGMERAMFALLLTRQQADAIAAGDDHTGDMDNVLKLVHAPAGALRDELEKRGLLEGEGLARVEEAKKARDLLAHWYLRDHEAVARNDERLRIKMAERLEMCVDRFQTVQSTLEAEAADALRKTDLPLVPDPASPLQLDVFDCVVSPEDARLLRELDRLDQSALDKAYNESSAISICHCRIRSTTAPSPRTDERAPPPDARRSGRPGRPGRRQEQKPARRCPDGDFGEVTRFGSRAAFQR